MLPTHYLQLKYQVSKIILFCYKTIETYARTFLPLNISAVGIVSTQVDINVANFSHFFWQDNLAVVHISKNER